jgi:lysophospholipase L1-like esterase
LTRRALTRAALVALGLALALLAAEALLQAGALALRWSGRELPATAPGGRQRLVALGDSNTYGIYLERDEPYPDALARLLAERGAGVEVFNLGYPGNNSSVVLAALPRILRELRPDVLTVMIGVNDWWTKPVAAPGVADQRVWDRLYRRSRVVRLLYLIGRSLERPTLSIVAPSADFDAGSGTVVVGGEAFPWTYERNRGGVANWSDGLRRNLRAIAALCAAAGTRLVLLTYPSEQRVYAHANAVLRETAAATGTPLLDLGEIFLARCPSKDCRELFFLDNHPTRAGHRLAAEHLRDWLLAGDASGHSR